MQPVFVGDVQGCADELEEILGRARRAYGDAFELWVVGDLVNRGPFNLRSLSLVRERVERGRARCVLGNHELGLLRTAWGLREPKPLDTTAEILERSDWEDWIEWLRRLPLVVSGMLGARRFAMVHAAPHPIWSLETLLERADAVAARLGHGDPAEARRLLAEDDADRDLLERLCCCRSVGAGDDWSAALPAAPRRAWHEAWSEQHHDYGVVYGHWSLQGLHVAPGLRGLDTGCVHHGRDHVGHLTAWIPDASARDPFAVPDQGFWQVRAHRRYVFDAADGAERGAATTPG